MSHQYKDYIELDKKNRAVVTILWYSILLMTFVEILDFVVYQFVDSPSTISPESYLLNYVLLPIVLHLFIGVAASIICRRLNKKHPEKTSYFMIIMVALLAHEVVTTHYQISVIYMIYVLPIFLSILFNNRKLTIIVASLCVALYVSLAFIYLPMLPDGAYSHDYMDFTATLMFMAASLLISIYIMNTFNDLINKSINADKIKDSLEKRIQLDPFTKLYNRAAFDDYLAQSISAYTNFGKVFSLIVIDIDDFKQVNDTYGHGFGDKVILLLVDVIRGSIRKTDLAFRYGGEEFAIILFTHEQNAFSVADKLRAQFNESSTSENDHLRFSISIGLCEIDKSVVSPADMFGRADKALYQAKHSGKNIVCVSEK